jgi:hypothetical protein
MPSTDEFPRNAGDAFRYRSGCFECIRLWYFVGADPAISDTDFLASAFYRIGMDVALLARNRYSALFSSFPLSSFTLVGTRTG